MNKDEKIIEIVKMLDWSLPEDEQKKAYNQLLSVVDESDCDLLIRIEMKATWHNATILIEEIGYPKNRKALPSLVELFKDMSWPGADKSIQILKSIDKKVVIPLIKSALKEAYETKDYSWIWGIQVFLEETGMGENDFDDMEVYDLLKYADFA